jgi:carbonic anhydrase
MLTFSDDELKAQIHEEVGMKPHFSMESFSDLDEDVRQSVARIQASPFIPRKESVRGFIYEVETDGCARSTRAYSPSAWNRNSPKFE